MLSDKLSHQALVHSDGDVESKQSEDGEQLQLLLELKRSGALCFAWSCKVCAS